MQHVINYIHQLDSKIDRNVSTGCCCYICCGCCCCCCAICCGCCAICCCGCCCCCCCCCWPMPPMPPPIGGSPHPDAAAARAWARASDVAVVLPLVLVDTSSREASLDPHGGLLAWVETCPPATPPMGCCSGCTGGSFVSAFTWGEMGERMVGENGGSRGRWGEGDVEERERDGKERHTGRASGQKEGLRQTCAQAHTHASGMRALPGRS